MPSQVGRSRHLWQQFIYQLHTSNQALMEFCFSTDGKVQCVCCICFCFALVALIDSPLLLCLPRLGAPGTSGSSSSINCVPAVARISSQALTEVRFTTFRFSTDGKVSSAGDYICFCFALVALPDSPRLLCPLRLGAPYLAPRLSTDGMLQSGCRMIHALSVHSCPC